MKLKSNRSIRVSRSGNPEFQYHFIKGEVQDIPKAHATELLKTLPDKFSKHKKKGGK